MQHHKCSFTHVPLLSTSLQGLVETEHRTPRIRGIYPGMSETTSSEWSTDSDTVSTLSATDTILDTASSVSQTSGEEDQEAEPELEISVPSAQPVRTPEGRQRILDTYLSERAKFFKHIKRRAKKFEKKSREDYDRARWGREPVKKPKPVKAAPAAGQNGGEMNRLASAAASAARAEVSHTLFVKTIVVHDTPSPG